jgi:hypothetical protein
MTEISFGKVWYRPEKGQWDDRKIPSSSGFCG